MGGVIRVLHVIGAMDRGGAETLIMNLYRSIDRSEIQFDFLVHEERECDYDSEIASLGGKLFRVPRFNGLNTLAYRRVCECFFSAHPEHRVVHGHIGSSAALYLGAAKRAGRFAIAHSHLPNYKKGPLGLAFALASYPTRFRADYFYACSLEAGVDRFGKGVVKGDRFAVLNNGIDVDAFRCDAISHEEAKRALGFSGVPVFGHIGRLEEQKNHRFLLDVFAAIQRRLPGAVLLLAGRGPLEAELKSAVEMRGLGENVVFLGVRDDVAALMKAMDVFVFPSVCEGLGVAAIEAQAAGLPSILSTGVPKTATVTRHARRLPLAIGFEAWADACVEAYIRTKECARSDAADEVRKGGFDIADSAERVSRLYRCAAGQGGSQEQSSC